MFYSHEVLTSRKYGVATIWLVATLGQKSSAHKVTRKAILDVNVPKACETIITPEAPMALRLQSSLLYGVTRVYSQQCGYVLADSQHAQAAIRALFKSVHTAELQPEATKARREQIVLEDDPSFMPGFDFSALDSDLLDLDIGVAPQRYISETLSLQTPVGRQSQFQLTGGLQLPSSSSDDIDGFILVDEKNSSHGARPSSFLTHENGDIFLPEIDIGLDAEGNFIEFDGQSMGAVTTPDGQPVLGSDSVFCSGATGAVLVGVVGASAKETRQDGLPTINDGYSLPPPETKLPFSGEYRPSQDESDLTEIFSAVDAPQRRKTRIPRLIPLDRNIELRNRDLLAMNNRYLPSMAEDWKRIAASRGTAQAKRNAEYWLLGRGIASVGEALGRCGIRGPLAEMWSGNNLYFLVTGKERYRRASKRKREDGSSSGHGRHVRPRQQQDGAVMQYDDDTLMQGYDLEVGREGQEPLEDISSAMPWNISASIRGSSVSRGLSGITGGPGSLPGSLTRHGSRQVSASPLFERGTPSGDADWVSDPFDADDLGSRHVDEEFELYGPSAGVDTQTAGQSQWQKAILDRESNNFFEFIINAIENKRISAATAGMLPTEVDSINFEDLLPTESNSRTVAAQALFHVLTLGTKNLILANQWAPFAPIAIHVL